MRTTGAYTITPAELSDGDYSLTVTATDAAGNISAASSALNLTVDTTTPAQPAITTTTTLTTDATPTIEGTAEAGSTVTLLSSGVAIGTTTANGDGQFSITTSTLADSNYVLTVTATDAAGNISAASSALNLTVDTTAPAKPAITTTTALTNDSTPAIEGVAEAGSTVTLFVDGETTGITTTADGTTGAYTITPAELSDGAYSLTVTATDAAGNISAASDALSITIDATLEKPIITTTADQLSSDDATPTIAGTAEAGSTVNLLIDSDSIIATTTADESGQFSITTPSLFDNDYSLTVTATDAAGNTSESDALSITIDTGADANPVITTTDSATNDDTPSITGIARPGSTVTLFIGDADTGVTADADATSGIFSITAPSQEDGTYDIYIQTPNQAGDGTLQSESISLTIDTSIAKPVITTASSDLDQSDATPTIEGTAEADSTVTLLSGGVAIGTTTANGDGQFSITTSTLADNTYSLTVTATDAAGNISDASDALSITIDATAPGKPSIITTTSLTNDATPTIEGIAEAGSTVTLFVDGETTGITTTADETTGAYTITPAELSDGDYSLTVTATDAAGNISAASDALSMTVDATAPAQPAITTTTTLTSDATPTIEGTAEADSTVTLLSSGVAIGTTTANGDGQFSITTSTLADSNYVLTVTATDAAGNISAASSALNLTVDTTAPAQPSITTTTALTNDATPAIEGVAEAGSTVTLFVDGVTTGITTTADGTTGAYTIAPTVALSDGDYALTVTATDAAGNTSSASSALSITVDTTAPEQPVIATNIATTTDSTPTIVISADAGTTVTLYSNGTVLGTGVANSLVTITTPQLDDGDYDITATATDSAGNISDSSTELSFSIDSTAPIKPLITTSTSLTNDSTPTIEGIAEAGSTVTLLSDGSAIATGVADDDSSFSIISPEQSDGDYSLTVTAADSSGNISEISDSLSLTIDTALPGIPRVTTTETATNDTTPTIEGIAEAGSTVTLFVDGTITEVTATADVTGAFTITLPEKVDGTYDLTFTARDGAGNTSSESSVFSLTVDTIAPSEPSITTTTSLTNDSTPAIEGVAEAGSTVTLFVDGETTGVTATADGTTGAYTIAPTEALSDGAYALTVTATDAAGNISDASDSLSITIDATAPGKPSIITTTSLTNDATPTIEGIAEAGSTVELFNGDVSLGTTTADGTTGAYTITPAELSDGAYSLTVTATDTAGNISAASDAHINDS